ncbi:protein FAR1-RELATED SEQUENCE 5-like [Dioscorea cayenensis subsp. rotundata]|uniref:Protein FAR1-RELATED SEQUENCE n=1 Tax=Dioscorea cayennensis subsp. rotundata TaxID=55577 RepID=A0AB40AWI7_DIOCR|nr:protein FAR1-RELATED SEQUENCE 5-like [Dioscorea cayenensis subsp. rotundata]
MEPNGLDLLLSINPIDVVGSSVVANSVPQILVEESYAVESSKDGSLKMKSSVVGSFDWEYHSEENMIELDEGDENVNQCIYDMEKEKDDDIFYDDNPKLGKTFGTEEEAYSFYNAYALNVGFSIRKGWVKRNKDGVIHCRRFCCSKKGKRTQDKRYENLKIHRAETRTGCLAHMIISREDSGMFIVSSFEGQHNHELARKEFAHMLRSHRKISEAQATQLELAYKAGLTPTEIYELQNKMVGGRSNVGFMKKDIENHLGKKLEKQVEKGLHKVIMQYFNMMRVKDPLFVYDMQLDDEGMITNIFWADGKGRSDYEVFGDVVTFDTTYRTNNYERPFAPLLGINNHGQTIVFGASLLYQENVESFVWLFQTFVRVMNGKHPSTILTDQSAAMAKAIVVALPTTHHRLCIWHIYQNAAKHLAHVFYGMRTFAIAFQHVTYDYEDEASFLEAWKNLLEKFNLRENPWLLKLFGERKKWAMVYGRHIFCGNMMSTQRSESFNSLLRNYLTSKLGVARFFEQFERVLEDRRYAELQEDYKMMDQSISSKELCPILRQMVQLYTPNIFQKLKEEHNKILYVMVELLSERNHSKTYKAIHVDAPHHASVVTFDSSNETIECSCKKFDFSGIPCMHMLRVLDVNQKFVLPSKYILKRWTRKARDIDTCIFVSTTAEEDPIVAKSKRYMDMCHRYQKLISEASKCEEAYKEVVRHYFVLDAKVKDIVKMSHSGREDCLSTDDVYNHNLTCDYSDARGLAIRHKPSRGGRSTKRIKGPLEQSKKKKRTRDPLEGEKLS